jgi:hypothetical protein
MVRDRSILINLEAIRLIITKDQVLAIYIIHFTLLHAAHHRAGGSLRAQRMWPCSCWRVSSHKVLFNMQPLRHLQAMTALHLINHEGGWN